MDLGKLGGRHELENNVQITLQNFQLLVENSLLERFLACKKVLSMNALLF